MATQNGPLDFTGSIADITFYKRKDSDKTFAKQKAGPGKKQIRHDPRFRRTDNMCDEWKGCTMATQWVRRTLNPLDDTRDYNFVGHVSQRLKLVQKLDTEGIYGQRSVWLSRYPHVLEGFSITRKTPFDTLLGAPLTCTLEKETSSARVEIPRMVTGINFQPATLHPYFQIVASLGVVPDIHYTPLGYAPKMPDQWDDARALGVVAVVNPSHFMFAEVNKTRVGEERAAHYQPFRSLLEAGIPVAIGSDGPNNPFLNIMFATMHPTNPKEAVTREQAVIAYTRGSAFAESKEREKGMLKQGMLADLAVLSQDIFSVPPPELPRTESELTIIGGKIVYEAAPAKK